MIELLKAGPSPQLVLGAAKHTYLMTLLIQRAYQLTIVALTITFYFQIGYANQNTGEERLLTAGSGEESLLHPISF